MVVATAADNILCNLDPKMQSERHGLVYYTVKNWGAPSHALK